MKLASFVGAAQAKLEGSEKLQKNLRIRRKSAAEKNKWKAIVNSNLSFGRKRMCQNSAKKRELPKKVERENRKEKRKRKNC